MAGRSSRGKIWGRGAHALVADQLVNSLEVLSGDLKKTCEAGG